MKHNKSQQDTLSINNYKDDELEEMYQNFMNTMYPNIKQVKQVEGNIRDSPCRVHERYSAKGIKLFFTYQLIAWKKYGRDVVVNIPSVKKRKTDTVISHICGTRNCIVSSHLRLETKEVNDSRTYCHKKLEDIRKYNLELGFKPNDDEYWSRLSSFLYIGACNHQPKCCFTGKTAQFIVPENEQEPIPIDPNLVPDITSTVITTIPTLSTFLSTHVSTPHGSSLNTGSGLKEKELKRKDRSSESESEKKPKKKKPVKKPTKKEGEVKKKTSENFSSSTPLPVLFDDPDFEEYQPPVVVNKIRQQKVSSKKEGGIILHGHDEEQKTNKDVYKDLYNKKKKKNK